MSEVWQCPVWHPGDCEGTPACPPRCPRYVTPDGTAVTVYSNDEGHLVAIGDDGSPLAGATVENGVARVEVSTGVSASVGAEVCRQAIARAHERGDRRLTLEANDGVLETILPEIEPALQAKEPGRIVLSPDHPSTSPLTLAPARGADVGTADRVKDLLEPSTVAVFGATDRVGSIGRVLIENMQDFEGTVIPVSDRRDEILGLPTVESLENETIDLAIIALPASAVPDAVSAAIEADADAIAILSAGFGESDADGERREAELAELIQAGDVTAIGPNALGVLNTDTGLNATFAPTTPSSGGIAVVSHSGAMITAILDWAESTGVGIDEVVSLGNGVDLSAAELVRYWGRDPDIEAIAAYLEDLPDGRAFVEAARDVTPTTPIVALKAGRTSAGATAAQSHTGAMAGDDAGYEAAFDAAGVIRADGQDELFDLMDALSSGPLPNGPGVAVVTNAGGPGVIAADAVGQTDLELVSLSEETTSQLSGLLPEATDPGNPLDVLGDADIDRFLRALEIVLTDPSVGSVILTSTPHPLVSLPELVAEVDTLVDKYGVPIFACFPGVKDEELTSVLSTSTVSGFSDANRTARTLSKLVKYARDRRQPRASIDPIDASISATEEILETARTAGSDTLGVESLDLLDAYGIDVATTHLVRSPEEARNTVSALGDEAVMKAVASSLTHKTDVGGVQTGVTPDDAAETYEAIIKDVEAATGEGSVEAVAVQEPIEQGVEVLVGVTQHERFGPLVTVGLGGVFVEHLEDVAHGLAPLSRESARELLASLSSESLLVDGPRGESPPDLGNLAEAIARISRIGADHDVIQAIEVNPLIATESGAIAVDLVVELQ